MGNYLQSLRVPPPTADEDERNHPLYYDWTIPKWTPFREESDRTQNQLKGSLCADEALARLKSEGAKTGDGVNQEKSPSKDNGKQMSLSKSLEGAMKSARKTAEKAVSTLKRVGDEKRQTLKDALTSVVDTNDKKPPNLRTSPSQIAKSTALHGSGAGSGNSNKASKSSQIPSVKKVDYTRPHTVDQKKYNDMEDQASIKAATNVHTIKTSSGGSAV